MKQVTPIDMCISKLNKSHDPNDWKLADMARDQFVGLDNTNKELLVVLEQLYHAIPFDVLRMQAGNGFLDMERVDTAKKHAQSIIIHAKAERNQQ